MPGVVQVGSNTTEEQYGNARDNNQPPPPTPQHLSGDERRNEREITQPRGNRDRLHATIALLISEYPVLRRARWIEGGNGPHPIIDAEWIPTRRDWPRQESHTL